MKITLSPRAEKQLRKLNKLDQIAVAKRIREIRNSDPLVSPEKLAGYPHIFRSRVGNFRIVYRLTPEELYIILIGHRKEIYELLKQLFH